MLSSLNTMPRYYDPPQHEDTNLCMCGQKKFSNKGLCDTCSDIMFKFPWGGLVTEHYEEYVLSVPEKRKDIPVSLAGFRSIVNQPMAETILSSKNQVLVTLSRYKRCCTMQEEIINRLLARTAYKDWKLEHFSKSNHSGLSCSDVDLRGVRTPTPEPDSPEDDDLEVGCSVSIC